MEGTCPARKLPVDGERGPSCPHGCGKFFQVPGVASFLQWGMRGCEQKRTSEQRDQKYVGTIMLEWHPCLEQGPG